MSNQCPVQWFRSAESSRQVKIVFKAATGLFVWLTPPDCSLDPGSLRERVLFELLDRHGSRIFVRIFVWVVGHSVGGTEETLNPLTSRIGKLGVCGGRETVSMC